MITKKSTSSSKKDEIKEKLSKNVTSHDTSSKKYRKKVLEGLDIKNLKETLKQTFVSNYMDIDSIPDDVLGEYFLDFAESYDGSDFKNADEHGEFFCKYLMVQLKDSIDKKYPFESSLLDVMDKKEKETKFGNIMKAFDYLGWIIIVWAIIIVFKGYSDAPEGWRIIMGLYLIWWIISVAKSVARNTDVAKNTNKLMRSIITSRRMLHKGEDKKKVEEELDLQKILGK